MYGHIDWREVSDRIREWKIRPMSWIILGICQNFLGTMAFFADNQRNKLSVALMLDDIDPGYLMRQWISYWINPNELFLDQRWRHHSHPRLEPIIFAEPGLGALKSITQMAFPTENWLYDRYGTRISHAWYWRHIAEIFLHRGNVVRKK